MGNNTKEASAKASATVLVPGVCILWCHLQWHCIIKRSGCCGHYGYAIWMSTYLLGFLVAVQVWLRNVEKARTAVKTSAIFPITAMYDFFLFWACLTMLKPQARTADEPLLGTEA